MSKYTSIAFLFCLLGACTSTNKTTSSNPANEATKSCFTNAIVKDMRGLDGCQFLLELDNGEKLLPIEVKDKDFKWEHNQMVEIGYQEVEDAMSICMAENRAVNITCVKVVALTGGVRPNTSENIPCEKLNAPFDRNWMKDLTIKLKPKNIDRYKYTDGWAYHMVADDMQYIYDCKGAMLCEGERDNAKCKNYLEQMSEKFTIWVANN